MSMQLTARTQLTDHSETLYCTWACQSEDLSEQTKLYYTLLKCAGFALYNIVARV